MTFIIHCRWIKPRCNKRMIIQLLGVEKNITQNVHCFTNILCKWTGIVDSLLSWSIAKSKPTFPTTIRVQMSPDVFNLHFNVRSRSTLCSLERQMFHIMGNTVLFDRFIATASVNKNAYGSCTTVTTLFREKVAGNTYLGCYTNSIRKCCNFCRRNIIKVTRKFWKCSLRYSLGD